MTAGPPLRLVKREVFVSLPSEWPNDPMPEIQRLLATARTKVVVLDDDPTGTQTVHNIPVLTEWSVDSLRAELDNDYRAFYILTNSRSLPLAAAQQLNREIARNLAEASRLKARSFVVVSRSDSTLRGHFPGEVEALNDVLGPFHGVLLAPFFETGGRYTINDIHHLAEGESLTPVAETQFARDITFGYHNSNLPAWVEEKTGGRIRANEVASISVAAIRRGGPEGVGEELIKLRGGRVCVVNLANGRDLLVFVLGLLQAEAAGKRFLYRTAASFAAARAGIVPRPVLLPEELGLADSGGGLVAVGSYVPTSSDQLRRLISSGRTVNVEVNVRAVLTEELCAQEVARAAEAVNAALHDGRDTVLYTSREVITGADALDSLAIGRRVSESLMQMLDRITVRPRFIVAKGGITSSDVATKALRVRRAIVLGQILPGIPLWRLGDESRWPGMIYVSFPGNLGGPGALRELVDTLAIPR